MNADGTGARALGPANVRTEAAVSPDGTRFAFTLTSSLDPDGGGADPEIVQAAFTPFARSVTDDDARDASPAWTADGRNILFASDRDGDWDIWQTDGLTTGAAHNLTASSPAAERHPRASPDGRFIAFESDRGGDSDVYVMSPAGEVVANLSGSPARDTAPDWSPDSQQVVFASDRSGYTLRRLVGPPPTRAFTFCVGVGDTSGNEASSCARWRPARPR
jgi:Tol biopolymer transport system component